jgi:hypothetical protein
MLGVEMSPDFFLWGVVVATSAWMFVATTTVATLTLVVARRSREE